MTEKTDLEKFEEAKPMIDSAVALIGFAGVRFYLSEEEYKAGAALVAKIEADQKAALGQ